MKENIKIPTENIESVEIALANLANANVLAKEAVLTALTQLVKNNGDLDLGDMLSIRVGEIDAAATKLFLRDDILFFELDMDVQEFEEVEASSIETEALIDFFQVLSWNLQ